MTIRQSRKDGTPFVKVITDAGIIPGIKVDTGAKDMAGHPGEKIGKIFYFLRYVSCNFLIKKRKLRGPQWMIM